jgi:hypothetical protein
MEPQFRTIVLYGRDGKYGAQLPGIEATIWGANPNELFANLGNAVKNLSSAQQREVFAPLIETKVRHA